MPVDQTTPRGAVRVTRRFTQGLLLLGGTHHPRRFVLDPESGRPVMPMPAEWDPRSAPDETGAVLYLPDDSDPEVQIIAHPAIIDPRTHGAPDRWAAYHGPTREARWAALDIESVKWSGGVCDADEFDASNALRSSQGALLRELNADRDRLSRLCERGAGVRVNTPLAVGVDPDGIDVRASLGVVRVEFPEPCDDEGAAGRAIESLASGRTV